MQCKSVLNNTAGLIKENQVSSLKLTHEKF